MTLDTFLQSAKGLGMTRIRVTSPRGHDVMRGALALSADAIEDRCREDAASLSAETRHEYVCTVEDDTGARFERFTVRVLGGQRKDDAGHHVEPTQVNTPAALIGHLCRVVVDLVKHNTTLAMRIADGDTEATKELRKTQRAAMKASETDVQAKVIEWKREEEKESREGTRFLLTEAIGFGKLVLGRVSPEAAAGALEQFKASLTDEQLDALDAAIGAGTARKLLATSNVAKFVDIALTISPEAFQRLDGMLNDEQKKLLQGALATEMTKRAKATEEAAKPKAKSPANGAASNGAAKP